MPLFRSKAEDKVREAGYDPARLPPGQYLTEKWPVLHAGDGRPRLARPPRHPHEVLLEEREVADGDRALVDRQARVLGALRLPQRRRLLERGALRVLKLGTALPKWNEGPAHAGPSPFNGEPEGSLHHPAHVRH